MNKEEASDRHKELVFKFEDIAALGDPYKTGYRQIPKESENDPFRRSLLDWLRWLRSVREPRDEEIGRVIDPDVDPIWPETGGRMNPNALPRLTVAIADNIARLVVAFVGGASVVVPMVIMSLHRSETKCLITTSVSVLLFVFFMAFVVRASDKTTLAAATTYAAVLVVFVGTSLPPVGTAA